MKWKIVLLASTICLTLFFSRWIFSYSFDLPYLQDFYNLSQWRVPLSTRVMSDNELYQIAGWHLVHNPDVFSINPEAPPLGKFLYGWATVLTGNPFWASVFLYIACLAFFGVLAQLLFKNKEKSLLAVLLLALTPLYFSQISQTMLDLPQLLFLLIHTFLLLAAFDNSVIKWFEKKLPLTLEKQWVSTSLLFLSGLSLGLFSVIKIAVYVPFILIAAVFLLWRKKQLIQVVTISAGLLLGYLLPFIPYILQFSFIEWLRNEKWMVNFYLSANSSRSWLTPFVVFTTSFSGWYQGWWQQGWQYIQEWTLLWPVVVVSLFWRFKEKWLAKDTHLSWLYLQVLGISLLLANIFLPFWPRYFLLLLPFGCLLTIHYWYRFKKLLGVFLFILLIQTVLFWRPQPEPKLQFAVNNLVEGSYHELYRHLTHESQQEITPAEFYMTLRSFEHQLQVSSMSAEVSYPDVPLWQNEAELDLTITRYTPLGTHITQATVPIYRENNVWRMQWNWNILDSNWVEGATLETSIISEDIPPLTTEDGSILMEYRATPYLYLFRPKLEYSNDLITFLSEVTSRPTVDIEQELQVQYQNFDIIPIGFVKENITPEKMSTLRSIPSVSVETRARLFIADLTDEEKRKLQVVLEEHTIEYAKTPGKVTLILPTGEQKILLEQHLPERDKLRLPYSFEELFGRTSQNKP